MDEIFTNEVKKRQDKGESDENIVIEINPILDCKFQEMRHDFQIYFEDNTMSLPFKKAILASLLGQDDEYSSNILYNTKQLIIDDLDRQAMALLIESNNKLLGEDSELKEYAVLSIDNEPVIYPLDTIKEIRIKLRQCISYIRELQDEKKALEQRIVLQGDSEKSLIKDGFFILGGKQYKLLPKDAIKPSLNENYTPHEVKENNFDLRNGFSKIKDQGNQGSCLAFALTSICEYFFNSTNNNINTDLSEAFLYYCARAKGNKQNEDSGSRIDYSLEALAEFGICREELFKYDDNIVDLQPDEKAYEDAKGRKLIKAMNVQCNIDSLKSALSDGFPVVVSVNLYESFNKSYKGFVLTPSIEEIEERGTMDTHTSHAMVICGYNESEKIFIVRNSWGKGFGDNGYCYFPYSYFTNPNLVNWACIITEFSTGELHVNKDNYKQTLNFDKEDARIQLIINDNRIKEESRILSELQEKDENLRSSYYVIKQKLKNQNVRDELVEGTEKRLLLEIKKAKEKKEQTSKEKEKSLTLFDRGTRKVKLGLAIAVILTALIEYFSYSHWEHIMYEVIISTIVILFLTIFYFPYRKVKRNRLQEKWDDSINMQAAKIDMMCIEQRNVKLRMYVAGNILTHLFELNDILQEKYNIMKSYIYNLSIWYDLEKKCKNKMNPDSLPPFISLLNNIELDSYYDANKDKLIENVYLHNFLNGSYQLSENGIRNFQNDIKNSLVEKFKKELDKFFIYDYLSSTKVYSYLKSNETDIMKRLEDMDRKSEIFVHCNGTKKAANPHKVILLHTKSEAEKKNWYDVYPKAFTQCPVSYKIENRFKVTLIQIEELNYCEMA